MQEDKRLMIETDSRGVCTLSLNIPEKHNAFDDRLIASLRTILSEIEKDDGVRILVLTGKGETFSSGADLKWMKAAAQRDEATNQKDSEALAKLMRTLYEYGKPTVARINGSAFGGALGLIACCDIAIAVRSAQFAFTEVRFGLVPAVIAPYIIKAIGERHARRLFLSAERFTSDEATKVNLVHQVCDNSELDETINKATEKLLKAGPLSVQACKCLIRSLSSDFSDESSALLIAQLRASKEGQEGMSAFFEKRPPSWAN
ncbi:MAG: enoyl-CoA hydratase-related protein [Gammaproteobacteria bacterium]|nr:enoyl-CoA hydratase-related protein [Gammaproteobacteria bacterium]